MLLLTLLAGAASALVAPVVPRPRSARAAAAVELADCPVTQWGASIPDILAAQRATRAAPEQPFLHLLEPPSSNPDDQQRWLADHRDEVNAKLASHGAVNLRGWDLVKTPEGFRAAYEALGLEPCRDPLDAVSARTMFDKASGVYEAVNKEYAGGAVRRAAPDAGPHDEELVRGERLVVVRSLFNC